MEKLGLEELNKVLAGKNLKFLKVGYTIVLNSAILEKRLNCYDKLVYLYLLMRTFRGKKECFPAMKTISTEMDISLGQVSKSVKILKNLNYMKIRKGKKGLFFYEVNWK